MAVAAYTHMTEAMSILTTFVVVVLAGIFASVLSKKLGVSNILLLIILGSLLSEGARYFGLAAIPHVAMVALSIIALALIVFEGSSKFDFTDLNNFSFKAMLLVGLFILFNIVFLMPLYAFFFAPEPTVAAFLHGAIFAIIVIATDAAAVFYLLKEKTGRVMEFLEVESIVNTPVIVILPFLLIDFLSAVNTGAGLDWGSYGIDFIVQIIVGLGTGLLVGILFFRVMKRFYDQEISPLSLITAALLAYVLAENLDGSGVIAVAVLGFMFGNTYLAGKQSLASFNNMLSNSLEIIVFVLVGFIVSLRMPLETYLYGFVAFLVIVCTRYIAVRIAFLKEGYSARERWFMILVNPKGIATAVMVFSLSILAIEPLTLVLELTVLTIIYSVIVATVVARFSHKFLPRETSDSARNPRVDDAVIEVER